MTTTREKLPAPFGWLCAIDTNERIRPATREERDRSTTAAITDDGVGEIEVTICDVPFPDGTCSHYTKCPETRQAYVSDPQPYKRKRPQ
jgi:hypothetical protein